jgi:protease I
MEINLSLCTKKVLFVIAPDQFRDEELAEPKKVLEAAGAEITVASTRAGPAKGMLGAHVVPDLLVEDAHPEDYDAVVVVGGMGSPEHLWNHAPLHALLQEASKAGKIIGTICLSGALLGKSGIARGKRATCWPDENAVAALMDGGVTYEKGRVLVDGNLVTADGPPSARDFGETLAKVLNQ